MALSQKNPLEKKILAYLRRNAKETARLEYKREVDLSDVDRRAELIRDVISLANSEGESPRSPGYLVLGFCEGEYFDVGPKKYEASKFGKILDANISPPLSYEYDEFPNGQGGRFGVLTIQALTSALYIVRQDSARSDGRWLLKAGQSWGRRADRKIALDGDDIQTRLKEIVARMGDSIRKPLNRRIEKLEAESGPVFEVKRHRFELERTRDWSEIQNILERLFPYAREFDSSVQSEIMSAIYDVTSRTHHGMTRDVASVVGGLLDQMMPLAGGGLNRPAPRQLKKSEREQLKRIGDRVFEMTWDACRYLRDMSVAQVLAQQYWQLIRFAKLNCLKNELERFLHEARRCQEICLEGGARQSFHAGHECIQKMIEDALLIPRD
jgi:hypothetical protein